MKTTVLNVGAVAIGMVVLWSIVSVLASVLGWDDLTRRLVVWLTLPWLIACVDQWIGLPFWRMRQWTWAEERQFIAAWSGVVFVVFLLIRTGVL